jgi:hypothetical protein
MLCQFLWKEQNPDKAEEEYDEYRKSYCLNYIRTFFNEHMDDSWFRSLYSPLGKFRVASQERDRCIEEAKVVMKELDESLENNSDEPYFVKKARLGGGVKTAKENAIPTTHAISMCSQVIPIQEVPSYVTDEQLTTALMSHCSSGEDKSDTRMYSGSPAGDLTRFCYFYCTNEMRKDIIQNLNHKGGDAAGNATEGGASHVPRKEDTYIPKTLELKVECSDAHGRADIDADGKGGAPEDNAGIPSRSALVFVSTQPITPPVKVLSVAVSSKERIAVDQASSLEIANAYDKKLNIPEEYRLETLLKKAVPSLAEGKNLEDALDVSIAYLRRVHLFSYYNGCVASENVAGVFSGTHAANTIHLRLANADEILQSRSSSTANKQQHEEESKALAKDLLVSRLDDAIQKSITNTKEFDTSSNNLISAEIDQQAHDIESQEEKAVNTWIEDHAAVDSDGRARCSFHFCRKLFKDVSFLKKHLIKKHSEFLKAEQAKCHDPYMMTMWDKQERRPVPPILVDCGRAFSTVCSPVLGAATPLAADPEPHLWKRQEERRQQEEENEQTRQERYQQNHRDDQPPPNLNGPLSEPRGNSHKPTFVDVDDMKVEKVEMAFDQIEIPVQPPKKKKKKKKLL